MGKREEIREKALGELQKHHVLMLDGHFDFGNRYHGRVYLNPHQLFCQPSIIWRFAQDLIDVLPAELLGLTDVVAGPVTGGAHQLGAAHERLAGVANVVHEQHPAALDLLRVERRQPVAALLVDS